MKPWESTPTGVVLYLYVGASKKSPFRWSGFRLAYARHSPPTPSYLYDTACPKPITPGQVAALRVQPGSFRAAFQPRTCLRELDPSLLVRKREFSQVSCFRSATGKGRLAAMRNASSAGGAFHHPVHLLRRSGPVWNFLFWVECAGQGRYFLVSQTLASARFCPRCPFQRSTTR